MLIRICFLNKLRTVYECLISKGKEIIILGDFNIDMLQTEYEIHDQLCQVYDLDKHYI